MENHMLTNRNEKENKSKKIKNLQAYLQNRVMPLLGPLQMAALKQQPTDIPAFCLQYLK